MSDRKATSLVAVAILFAFLLLSGFAYQRGTVDYVNIVISPGGAERVVNGDSSSYLVYAEGETFRNSDSLWHWKWDSSDLHGTFKQGGTYRAKVYGWRVKFLSWYRNIVEVETR